MVKCNVGDDRNFRAHHIGGIPSAQHANFDDCHIHCFVGKMSKRCSSDYFKIGWSHSGNNLSICDCGNTFSKRFLSDWHTITRNALGQMFEVRARVRTNMQTMGHQQLGDDLCGRALAIGSSYMNDWIIQFWMCHHIHERRNVVERWRFDSPSFFVACVLVKIDERLGVIHSVEVRAMKQRGVGGQRVWNEERWLDQLCLLLSPRPQSLSPHRYGLAIHTWC